ncbi:hypothetical protein H9L05_17310 [Hymenobacter qilianensis]|uniref:UvrD-like helicase ATP-binding domain-containing protein n=1 Tax=Hymenobacter qilianensis TaxID=1385715 RepID=A0A7H0GTT9_9BACT|nr:hypothetical protein [Hymenobacter qilianensis]QNP51705.1 hypothetical protein H9L05_17310 [Hymenobacter qilianensis]
MPATFRIYSSSAGSGKTYQLTKEYLKLALGPMIRLTLKAFWPLRLPTMRPGR